jgi:hypothetical protein
MRERASITTKFAPASASLRPAAMPAAPAPMTATSTSPVGKFDPEFNIAELCSDPPYVLRIFLPGEDEKGPPSGAALQICVTREVTRRR